MSYKTDGSSHHNGIKNEGTLKDYIQQNPNAFRFEDEYGPLKEVEKKGGTKDKNDLIACCENGEVGISAKNWTGATFDWVNDSATIKTLRQSNPEFNKIIESAHAKAKKRHGKSGLVEEHRKDVNQCGSDQIVWFDSYSDSLRQFLHASFAKIRDQYIIIHDVKERRYVCYKGSDHPIFKLLADPQWKPSLTRGRGSTSAAIVGTNLRLRCVTNNGIRAMLGVSSSNKSSQFVLKIQQDNVKILLNDLGKQGKTIIVPYE